MFVFTAPSQILGSFLGINIYYYGVILAISIIFGVFVADFISVKYYKLKKDTIIDLAPYLVLFGILGARLYYCILNLDFYLRFPTEILALRHGGISIHGAIIGGFIGLIIFAKRHNISILKLADVSALGLALAQSIGRWGNFFNSEAFGYPTNLPWKLYISEQYRPIPYTGNEFFHPTFLYESVLDFILFLLLFWLIKNNKISRSGNIALIYLILYSFIRIFVEYFRIDSTCYILGYPIAIIVSIGIIIFATMCIFYNNLKKVE